jgi:hypothetical protein
VNLFNVMKLDVSILKSFLKLYMKIFQVARLEDKDKNLRFIDSGHSPLILYSWDHSKQVISGNKIENTKRRFSDAAEPVNPHVLAREWQEMTIVHSDEKTSTFNCITQTILQYFLSFHLEFTFVALLQDNE